MAGSSRLVAPTLERLRTILKQIADGELLVPRFQRSFVWTDNQRLQLLDSVRRGMPIGSILVWRSKSRRLLSSELIGPFPVHEPDEFGPYVYLLDGLQRLATLYGALWARAEKKVEDGGVPWPILYDLEKEAFRLPPRRGEAPVTSMELWRVYDGRAFYEHEKRLIDAGKEIERRRAEELRDAFEDYVIPLIPIQSEDLEQVTVTFTRVNSQGTKMSEVHMVNAVSTGPGTEIGKRLDTWKEDLAAIGWGEIDSQVLLNVAKTAVGIDYYRSNPQQIRQKLEGNPVVLDQIPPALQRAIRLLMEWGVAGPKMLPYDPQIVLLAEAARRRGADLDGNVAARLRRWFWQTTYTEYFTGATNAKLRRAVRYVTDLATNLSDQPIDDLDPSVDILDTPRGNSVRTKAFLLFLATLRPYSLERELEAGLLLAQGALDAAPKIFRDREVPAGVETNGFENRWLVPPGESDRVRDAIRQRQPSLTAPWGKLLEGHAFSKEAADALAHGDIVGTLRARRKELLRRERAFLEDLGLSYSVAISI